MKEERYFYVPDAKNVNELPESEAQHATRVLRLTEGDEIFLMDGEGLFYEAQISMASKKHCFYNISKALPQQKSWHGNILLAIAPTKMMERIEWMVEKATEIGFDGITFLDCKFSERHTIRTDRIEKIVVSAMKQSRKPFKPTVNPMVPFKEFIDNLEKASDDSGRTVHKYIAHCYDNIPSSYLVDDLKSIPVDDDVVVLVGPEGDFSIDEADYAIKHGFEPISLGPSRLRTETAGLMAVTMGQLVKVKR